MNKLKVIFKHEFRQITKGKLFIIMTFIGPLLFGALTILPGYFAAKSYDTEDDATIAIYSGNDDLLSYLTVKLLEKELVVVKASTIEEGNELVIGEECKGFAIIPDDVISAKKIKYYSTTGTDLQYSEEIEQITRDYIFDQKKDELGLTAKQSKWLTDKISIESFKLSDDGSSNSSNYITVLIVTMGMSMLIMMTVLIYGLTTARSILAEKASKTVEILLSSISPYEILLGKALGAGAAGLLQFSVWMSMVGLAAKFVVPLLETDINLDMLTPQNVLIIFLYFVFGFIFYLFIYGALGANVENEQNLGQVQMPIQLFLMIPMIISSTIIANPNGMFTKVLSYIPFTSPTVMTARLLIDPPGTLSIVISLLILVSSLVLVLLGSAKLFKIGILTAGKKTNIIQVIGYLFRKD